MKLVKWLWHWTLQGVKLWIFAVVAYLCIIPVFLLFLLLESNAEKLIGFGWAGQLMLFGGRGVCLVIAISVFTAVLAAQLTGHPLNGLENNAQE